MKRRDLNRVSKAAAKRRGCFGERRSDYRPQSMEESFAHRRVTVMGLGTFGAGLAATRFLAEHGAQVTVTDLRSESQLSESVAKLADLPSVVFHLGRHDERDFLDSDLIVVSPSVRPDNSLVAAARAAGVAVTSEIRLFWQQCAAPIIGVTGSNGKSTTATLVHDILAADGRRAWLGGNIGRSLLGDVEQIAATDWVVLELSSFQLADLNVDHRSPHVAVITNVSPNHLDWHGTYEAYVEAKQTILRWQSPADLVVRNHHHGESGWPAQGRSVLCGLEPDADCLLRIDTASSRLLFASGEAPIDLAGCRKLRGRHMHAAAMLAATTCCALGVARDTIQVGLQDYQGLPHRLQWAGDWQGRTFINDSASTTPESTIAALESFAAPVVLIAGGSAKGSSLNALAAAIVRQARSVIVIGEVCAELVAAIVDAQQRQSSEGSVLPGATVVAAETLREAVEQAREQSRCGDVILFSPGFASGAMFRNFSDRGEEFVRLVDSGGLAG